MKSRFLSVSEALSRVLRLIRTAMERPGTLERQLNDALVLLHATEERSRTLERQLNDTLVLLRATEERSRSLEYQLKQAQFMASHQIDALQKWYVEWVSTRPEWVTKPESSAARSMRLETLHPIALSSRDHSNPESTSEGVVRPTRFVRHCIEVLGQGIQCLDLGAGAGGLVFEYVMNGIVAIGIDGSDYCRLNRIGYWPLLPDSLRTCDITHPFRLRWEGDGSQVHFDVISMWEVLEHIAEDDLVSVLHNVEAHLDRAGYFVGSISLLEYVDASGRPYHVTLKEKPWWKQKFRENGLVMLDVHPFHETLFCRGNGPRFQDYHNYRANPNDGFHFVARKVACS